MNEQHLKNSRRAIEMLLVILLFTGLLYALFDVLKVFIGIFTFSVIFAISFAKPFKKLVYFCKGKRKLAAIIYAFLLIAILVQPFLFLISTLSHHVKEMGIFVTQVKEKGLPPLSSSISNLPMIGKPLSDFYLQLQLEPHETIALHEHQIKAVLRGIITKGAGILGAAVEITLGIIISAFLLNGGSKIMAPFSNALKHLFGKEDTEALISTCVVAIKSVAIGIMGTALIAAFVSWIGLFIAGIPFSMGIAAIVFFLVVIQVGPLPVWIPVVIWLFVQGQTGWGVFMIFYGIILLVIDAVVKPLLISQSGKLPFLVLFPGVIGGMIAWGFTGMFKGAIIVAVFYTVLINWLERKESSLSKVA